MRLSLLYIYICGYNKGIDDDVDFQVDLKAKAGQGWRQGCARNRRHTQKCQRTLSWSSSCWSSSLISMDFMMTIIISNNKSAAKSRPASVQLVTDRSFQAKPVPKFKVVPWERTLVRLKVHDHMITCTQIHKYTNTQIHKYTSMGKHIAVWPHWSPPSHLQQSLYSTHFSTFTCR